MLTSGRFNSGARGERGFTLIELSIVLVIIGLIVGGVLVGQDLIRAAEIRSTVSQIEKYNTAVNTFRNKYNALPGDMANFTAVSFGFLSRAGTAGCGDGNGVIEGNNGTCGTGIGIDQGGGETGLFWSDLTYANGLNLALVEGSFSSAADAAVAIPAGSSFDLWFPQAKLGKNQYFVVFSAGGTNYYEITQLTSVSSGAAATPATPVMTVIQAYSIDKKVDDGYPTTGVVQAVGGSTINSAATTSGSAGAYCNNTGTTPTTYQVSYNNGASPQCAISMRFQ